MYKPLFNHVLVEVDDKDKQWGSSKGDELGGPVYREGSVVDIGNTFTTANYPINNYLEWELYLKTLLGKRIMWNEGHEAGKTFEEDGKLYALIYWWDVVGVQDDK